MKLNLGCGPVYIDGWVNSDNRPSDEVSNNWKLDENWDFTEVLPLDDMSVDFILAWHILEHMNLGEADRAIRDWYRVLKLDGQIAVAVPDVWKVTDMWKTGSVNDFIGAVNIAGPYNGYDGDYHKWVYTQHTLENKFREVGFKVEELRQYEQAQELSNNRDKIGFADYNAQILATKI